MHDEMGPVRQNLIQRTERTAYLSVLMTVHNFSINTQQHRTLLIVSPLISRQTSIKKGIRHQYFHWYSFH